MYSRTVTCTIVPSKVNEFKNELNNELLPRIQEQKGFVDNLESLDPVTGEFSCTTLWETKADVDNYNNGLFQEIAAKLGPLMQDAPAVKTLPVENSSAHDVRAGRAAA
jgi:quinol monooxygenase YgiN